jgi:hypothetical protein
MKARAPPAARSGPNLKRLRAASVTFAGSRRSSGGRAITAPWIGKHQLSAGDRAAFPAVATRSNAALLSFSFMKAISPGLDPGCSSHVAPRFLISLKFRIAGSPSRRIVARLRSWADNIIALTTAEHSFIVP